MRCVPAPACRAALDQATARWTERSRVSDGICGDAKHQARKSDHNEGNAWDLTHDPADGVDCHILAEGLRQRVLKGLEPRIKYIIWNRRIFNPSVSPEWRPYSGSNPHTKHMHVSIHAQRRNDAGPWWSWLQRPEPAKPTPAPEAGDQEAEMICLIEKTTRRVFVVGATGKPVYVADEADYNALAKAGVRSAEVSQALIRALGADA